VAWWLGSKVKRAQHSARWRISSPAGEASNRAFERGASDSLAGYSGDGVPAPFLFVGKKNSDSVMSGIGFLQRSGLGSNSARQFGRWRKRKGIGRTVFRLPINVCI